MKLPIAEILKFAGTTALNIIAPGAVSLINSFLPDDTKLPANPTVTDAKNAIATLPADKQVQIMSKELDVELVEIKSFTDVQMSVHEVDKTGNTTRPEIARDMANIIGFAIIGPVSGITYRIINGTMDPATAWTVIGVMIGVPVTIVLTYFGKRTVEKQQKYQAATGVAPPQRLLSQVLGTILSRKG